MLARQPPDVGPQPRQVGDEHLLPGGAQRLDGLIERLAPVLLTSLRGGQRAPVDQLGALAPRVRGHSARASL